MASQSPETARRPKTMMTRDRSAVRFECSSKPTLLFLAPRVRVEVGWALPNNEGAWGAVAEQAGRHKQLCRLNDQRNKTCLTPFSTKYDKCWQ